MRPFSELTLIGQARRLRPHAIRLLEGSGVRVGRLRQLTEATNVIFRVDMEDGRRFVLRMTSPKSAHSVENVRSEIEWIRALNRDAAADVPVPIAWPDGDDVCTLEAADIEGAWHCTRLSWIPGKMLSDRLTPGNLTRHGALSARLHEHGETFKPSPDFRIRAFRTLFPYADPTYPNAEPIVLFDGRAEDLMPRRRAEVFLEVHDRVQEELDLLFEQRTPHVIHNDLHRWNVKVHRTRIYALDFEDLLLGHPIQDIATTLYYYRYSPHYPERLDAFRRGYESLRPWPEDHPGQLERLIAARGILLANFVAASRDADDRRMAPEYLTRIEDRLRTHLATA